MKTEIICVIDRSGSMEDIKTDAIDGFNAFLASQLKVEGEARMTIVMFNDCIDTIAENLPLKDVMPLNISNYVSAGTTALLDAVGTTIDSVGARLAGIARKDRPDKVIFAILTDGQENASRKFRLASEIKEKIQHQELKYSWEFLFLAANQDTFATGSIIGVKPVNTFNFDATGKGVRSAYANINCMATAYRTGVNPKDMPPVDMD